jgi:1-acyl-sn-glycerol-3-phosphate acyltransferase
MKVLALNNAKIERYSWILTLRTNKRVRVTGIAVIPSYDASEPTVVMDRVNGKEVIVYSNKQVQSIELDNSEIVKHLPTQRKKAAVEG